MRYHMFQKFFGKMVKIKETSFLSTKGMYLSCHGCNGKRSDILDIAENSSYKKYESTSYKLQNHQKKFNICKYVYSFLNKWCLNILNTHVAGRLP